MRKTAYTRVDTGLPGKMYAENSIHSAGTRFPGQNVCRKQHTIAQGGTGPYETLLLLGLQPHPAQPVRLIYYRMNLSPGHGRIHIL